MAYLGEDIPKLGFGLMRLPKDGDASDVEQTSAMVDRFLEAGFTYFDTARAYGDSEETIGRALVARYPRETYFLATKNAAWLGAEDAAQARAMFTTSLEKTGAGYVDFYLLHNLGNTRTQVFEDYNLWEFAFDLKKQGLVKHVGFSFHDKASVLEEILQTHPEAEFVQLQINYADWNRDDVESRKCYEVARAYGKPVVIMEPVKGGLLAAPPASVEAILKEADPNASCASWAIRFAASLPGVITVLSGMSDIEQMEDNLATMKDFKPLSSEERDVIGRAQAELARIDTIPCTSCSYCTKSCPQGIPIPDIFSAVNMDRLYGNVDRAKQQYGFAVMGKGKASSCIQCGQCEAACPQHIAIIDELEGAAELLE